MSAYVPLQHSRRALPAPVTEIDGRRRLPDRRLSYNVEFWFPPAPENPKRKLYQLNLGFRPDGKLGEIFLDGTKAGSDQDSDLDDKATYVSLLLQFGFPIERLAHSSTRDAIMRHVLLIATEIEASGPDVDLQHLGLPPWTPPAPRQPEAGAPAQ